MQGEVEVLVEVVVHLNDELIDEGHWQNLADGLFVRNQILDFENQTGQQNKELLVQNDHLVRTDKFKHQFHNLLEESDILGDLTHNIK